MKLLFSLVSILISLLSGFSQNPNIFKLKLGIRELSPIGAKIAEAIDTKEKFTKSELFFEFQNDSLIHSYKTVADSFTVLAINQTQLKKLLQTNPKYLSISIPYNNGKTIEILLMKHSIATLDFQLKTSSGSPLSKEEFKGLHYWGIIKDQPNSMVAISFFENDVMGLIANGYGNIVIGKLNVSEHYIVYNDKDLKAKNNFKCGNTDSELIQVKDFSSNRSNATKCVRLYWEINHDIYQDKGSVSKAANFAIGLFNQSQLIYYNDNIHVELSELKIWDTPSPYFGIESEEWLISFIDNLESFNGDLAHLITYSNTSGGIASSFDGLCNPNWDEKKCFSGIDNEFQNFPTFSWSILVITHEQGHLLGSPHTHACFWNGDGTAIDACGPLAGYAYEGSCDNAPIPVKGTIMSYCHLNPNIGIDLSFGFGDQPADLINLNIEEAGCLTVCSPCLPIVENDNCANAKTLIVKNNCIYINGSICGATPSITNGSSCSLDSKNLNTNDVWFSFTASCTNPVINVQSGNYFDAVIEIYDGPCGTQIGDCTNKTIVGEIEEVYLTGLDPDELYYIRVYDFNQNNTSAILEKEDFGICIFCETPLPNLTSDNTSLLNNFMVNGNEINLTSDIFNNGNELVPLKSILKYFLSEDTNLDLMDFEIGSDTISTLGINQHSIEKINLNVCNVIPKIPDGNYYLGYVIDINNEVEESNEYDNEWASVLYQKVTVNCCLSPENPSSLYSKSLQCDKTLIIRNGNPTQGIIWYWQEEGCGKNKEYGSDETYIATSSGTYYLRAYDNTGNCWSSNCSEINIELLAPDTPDTLKSNSPQCSQVTISSGTLPPTDISWYWQGTSCDTSIFLKSKDSYLATINGSYKLRAFNNKNNCWSVNCSEIEVEILGYPDKPEILITNEPQCNIVSIFSKGYPPGNIEWYWQGLKCGKDKSFGNDKIFTALYTGTYYLRAYNKLSECWSEDCESIKCTVDHSPTISDLKLLDNYIIVSPLKGTESFQWFYNDEEIEGNTNALKCIGNGIYYCKVSYSDECYTISNPIEVYDCDFTPLENTRNYFKVYPNPTYDLLNIEGTNLDKGNLLLIISDVLGKRLKRLEVSVKHSKLKEVMDLKELNSGTYFLSVYTRDSVQTFKIIKL